MNQLIWQLLMIDISIKSVFKFKTNNNILRGIIAILHNKAAEMFRYCYEAHNVSPHLRDLFNFCKIKNRIESIKQP